MKREYIVGGCIGLVFVIAIIACVIVGLFNKKGTGYIPTIAKIVSLDEKGNVKEEEFKVKLENNDDRTKMKEFTDQINASIQSGDRYGLGIICDYIIHVDENISIRFKSNIKEYIEYIDESNEGNDKKIVTKAPSGFVDWILEKVNEK